MADLIQSKVSVAASTGVMTITSRIYLNPVIAATFSAVTSGHAYPTVTVGPGNSYVNVVLAVTPDTPVAQAAAEVQRFVGDLNNTASAGTLL